MGCVQYHQTFSTIEAPPNKDRFASLQNFTRSRSPRNSRLADWWGQAATLASKELSMSDRTSASPMTTSAAARPGGRSKIAVALALGLGLASIGAYCHYLVQPGLRTTFRPLARARLLARWTLRRRVRSGPRRGAGRSHDPTYFRRGRRHRRAAGKAARHRQERGERHNPDAGKDVCRAPAGARPPIRSERRSCGDREAARRADRDRRRAEQAVHPGPC